MSAASLTGSIGRLTVRMLSSVAGWIFIAPLALLVPKRRDWVAVIGRQHGRFLDNAKYFFLQADAASSDLRLVFISELPSVQASFADGSRECMRFPTANAIWFLLRCGCVVSDEPSWFRHFRYFLLLRARAIQLWHGVGCKWIEAGLWQHETGGTGWASRPWALRLRLLVYHITGRRLHYAAVACTSRFYRDEVFAPAFKASYFPVVGYPRNDFAQSLTGENRELAWSNVNKSVRSKLDEWLQLGRKLVLVTPTFRDSGTEPMQLDAQALAAIDAFAEAHQVEFLFKFHPSERNIDHIAGRHFHVCARDSDIYPLMPYAAALVSDYSSISMDFLLVDKPLLFLIPENDDYATRDRLLQFDPRTMMPGPIVPTWESLLTALLTEWSNDHYATERAALRRKAFDDLPQSDAVSKLLALMRTQGWITSR